MAEDDRELVQRFVNAFGAFDDLGLSSRELVDGDLTPLLLRPAGPDGWLEWRPIPADLPPEAVQELYACVPGPLPPLYERLILSYRWTEVDLGRLRLLANLPPGLRGLTAAICKDKTLFDTLVPAGFVQFGKGPDYDYDPICFDLHSRQTDGDCRVVKFDHEDILGDGRLREVCELAPTFRSLMKLVIEDADKSPSRKPAL
jgi:hypothetical protein